MKRKHAEVPHTHANGRVVERPDGFYWKGEPGHGEHGPFPTLLDAVTHMQAAEDSEYEPEESAEQAEKEISAESWIDPDTGEPAGQGVPRIEDH